MITALQEKEIPEYRIAKTRRSKSSTGETFQRYGKGFSGKTLKDDIEMISFNVNGVVT
ncbi:MAG: hypothetical protein Q9N32_03650 [Gammaproteobacteria bacterium]|nr:hypothetical protein [Gammaproteobacteria bacterium]